MNDVLKQIQETETTLAELTDLLAGISSANAIYQSLLEESRALAVTLQDLKQSLQDLTR